MGLVGVILIILACPAIVVMLKMDKRVAFWAFFALGAMPILSKGFNADAALIDLSLYPGHTKGILLSLTDALAAAIAIHFWKVRKPTYFIWIWVAYLVLNLPGVFVSEFFLGSFSYLSSPLKAMIYFLACYAAMTQGGMRPLLLGLGVGVIANSYSTIENSIAGQMQASGLIGHRNTSGLVNNLAIPPLLVAIVTWKRARIAALALAMSAAAAVLGGSRAVILLYAATVGLTLLAIMLINPNKRAKTITTFVVLGSLAFVPAVAYKMNERFTYQGTGFTLEVDAERVAFEHSAEMIQADYPMGIGHNQYAVKANAGGYAERAGISWATLARLAIVHNSYALVRTEGGPAALAALFLLLGSIMWVSGRQTFQRRHNPERLYAAATLVAIGIFAFHIRYEWAIVGMFALYPLGFMTAMLSYVALQSRRARQRMRRARVEANMQLAAEAAE